ncbi:ABC transporter ATP-binding protein [Myroides odoratimimus]|uniref:ABC transporter ATP-binding protein n=1 Tax=Myroides odoratimimus TaxID=76832 RepID=UPI00073F32BC|nr:ABC transporter ATP-binding protein [Myroides odoratimimus]MDM1060044.1 ABC transporter ATP-binding protein [Myroides odoratimimus]MDM1450960.1 ABC transporter ATP-binding protein [Myroides odoratimimus]MDM1454277.1 ABC transporter ATP-binding protein [Myroides odoratimimus]MDM1458086.1 ABC transporter ATP-binding protein [Myroides odoratimimus]MDM1478000.1 ABC transporter ATP-binding protein [Myroides odoratimimus]
MSLIKILKQIKPFVMPYKRLIIGTLVLTAVGSFAVQVNALIIRSMVDTLNDVVSGVKDLAWGYKMLVFSTVVLIVKEILNAFIQFGQKFFGEKLRIYVSRDISQLVVTKILTYRMAFYTSDENDSGKLQTRIDQGVGSITRLIQNFFIDILPLFANAIVALVFIYTANVYVGIVSTAMIPLYFYVSQLQASKLKGFRRKMRSYRENKNNGIISLINSITVIKSFVREPLEAEKHEEIQYDMTENQLQTRRMSFVFDAVKGFIEQFGLVVIILMTAYFVLKGEMTVGAIMFHVLLFNNVTAPIRQLHRIYDDVNDAMIYSETFFEIINADHEVETTGTYVPTEIKGKIEIKDVSFDYPNGTSALKEVSMTIEPNQTTALVGLSGAGKSTVINLLDKFYAPTSGQILLDGVDLREYDTKELRKHIGLVLQKNHIFQGSIAENIRYGNPDATIEEVELAAKKAYIHEQITELPQGYESDARLLSGGQQQRIAIARLFLKDPAIIFLDEPTASLDAIATEQIKKSLDAIKENRTVIIVSHSISQIIDAHDIVVMEKGRVVENGKHEELYENKNTYYEIFSAMANSLNLEKISQTLHQD